MRKGPRAAARGRARIALLLAAGMTAAGLLLNWLRWRTASWVTGQPASLQVRLTTSGVLVHPGLAVSPSTGGQLRALWPQGPVRAGQVLAVLAVPEEAPPVAGVGAKRPAPGCDWRSCTRFWTLPPATSSPWKGLGAPGPQKTEREVPVRSPASGWFFPGWSPGALLGSSGLSTAVPDLAQAGATAWPSVGGLWPAGQALGVVGQPWELRWLLTVPAADDPGPGALVAVAAVGRPATTATVLGVGPICGGRRLLVLQTTDGPVDAPADTRQWVLRWTTPVGVVVPVAAVREEAACGTPGAEPARLVVEMGRARPTAVEVHLLAQVGRGMLVSSSLPVGSRVLVRYPV